MIKLPLLCAAAALALATGPAGAQQSLSNPDSAFVPQDNPGNWQTTITRTARGHLIEQLAIQCEAGGAGNRKFGVICPAILDQLLRGGIIHRAGVDLSSGLPARGQHLAEAERAGRVHPRSLVAARPDRLLALRRVACL
ncbi:MAG: hypothetical protein U0995_00860, partial [Erythrobacter sp.]|nr:hypothetical protein [Erythrobacter sp.]